MKLCTYCAEEIKDEAIVCRYCGRAVRAKAETPATPIASDGIPPVYLVVVAAGAVPALWNLSLFTGIPRPSFMVIYFAIHLVVVGFGLWAARLRHEGQPTGTALGLLAGATEAVMILFVLTSITIDGVSLVPSGEDFIVVAATVLLFITGFSLNDVVERRRAEGQPVDLGSLMSGANSVLGILGSVLALIGVAQGG